MSFLIDIFFLKKILRDLNGEDFFFEPIAVIEHHGNTSKRGHNTCDVKDYATKRWYRTNDDNLPKMISSSEVSKQGYVVIYRRI